MRWTKYQPKSGATRFITRFLFLPKKINNETRWLEKATYKQEYCYIIDEWDNLCWIKEGEVIHVISQN